jgi:hypothetical protein
MLEGRLNLAQAADVLGPPGLESIKPPTPQARAALFQFLRKVHSVSTRSREGYAVFRNTLRIIRK